MFNVRLAGEHLYGKQPLTWLSLVVSFMASFMLSFFPLDVLGGILDLIESVSEGFLTYSLVLIIILYEPCNSYITVVRLYELLPSGVEYFPYGRAKNSITILNYPHKRRPCSVC